MSWLAVDLVCSSRNYAFRWLEDDFEDLSDSWCGSSRRIGGCQVFEGGIHIDGLLGVVKLYCLLRKEKKNMSCYVYWLWEWLHSQRLNWHARGLAESKGLSTTTTWTLVSTAKESAVTKPLKLKKHRDSRKHFHARQINPYTEHPSSKTGKASQIEAWRMAYILTMLWADIKHTTVHHFPLQSCICICTNYALFAFFRFHSSTSRQNPSNVVIGAEYPKPPFSGFSRARESSTKVCGLHTANNAGCRFNRPLSVTGGRIQDR